MSLFESDLSTGATSLRGLLDGDQTRAPESPVTVEGLVEAIARGGWPGFHALPLSSAMRGVSDVAGPIKEHTVGEYLSALERLFVVENQPAWEPHLRSRSILRRSAKRHFVDPSLAVAALEASPDGLLHDLNLLGLLFESLVVRDLRIYAQASEGRVKHYLDNKGLEIDAIVEAQGGWAAFEIKLGGQGAIDEAAASLKKFVGRIDTSKTGEPAALGVIVGTGYGYVREDGVQVIPIGALGP
jgi:uncharacterized protein